MVVVLQSLSLLYALLAFWPRCAIQREDQHCTLIKEAMSICTFNISFTSSMYHSNTDNRHYIRRSKD